MITNLLTILAQRPFKHNNVRCSDSVIYPRLIGPVDNSLSLLVSLTFSWSTCTTVHPSLVRITDMFGGDPSILHHWRHD